MSALVICLYVAAALETGNGLFLITKVGADPQRLSKAYTGTNVMLAVALTAFVAVVLILAAVRLAGKT